MDRPDSLIRAGQIVSVTLYGEDDLHGVTVVSLPCRETGGCWVFYYAPENVLYYIHEFISIRRDPPKPKLVK